MLFDKKEIKEYEIVLEAYYGKSKKLLDAQRCLDQVVKDIKEAAKFGGDKTLRAATSNSKSLKKAVSLMEEEFGCSINLSFSPHISPNAHTYVWSTVTNTYMVNKALREGTKPGDGIYVMVTVFTPLVTQSDLTGGELMAVILHEIGHNVSRVPILISLDPLSIIVQGGQSFVWGNIEQLFNRVKTTILPTPLFRALDNIGGGIFKAMAVGSTLLFPIALAQGMAESLISSVGSPLGYLSRYFSERGADSFAVAYGYGSDLQSFMEKLRLYQVSISKTNKGIIPPADLLADFNASLTAIVMVHPQYSERCKNIINKLERDLNAGTYPPEMEKELRKELAYCKEMYSQYENVSYSKSADIRKALRPVLAKLNTNVIRNNKFVNKNFTEKYVEF